MSKKLAVIAFGGNALLKGDEVGTVDQQEKNAYDTCKQVINLLKNGFNVIITHGNGPQVGNVLLKNDAGQKEYNLPQMPLDVCVADTQGSIGYMIERAMRNVLNEEKMDINVIPIITQVLVDRKDPAFDNPTKPVGPYYLKEESDLLAKSNKWIFKEDARKRGWRRVVASPVPIDIMNKEIIKELAERGNIVICCGGGGIPVFRHPNGHLEAIEAVIDKDLASAVLAKDIKADNLYIVTDVPKVYINFNKPNQKQLDKITCVEAREYYEKGEFGAGSMGPKVMAGILFAENGGKEAVITEAHELNKQDCGTRIINS